MTIIDKKRIEAALKSANDLMRKYEGNKLSEKYIEAKAAAETFQFVLENSKETDCLDPDRLLATKMHEALANNDGIDFTNTFGLVTDLWLFLAGNAMPPHSMINREAFFHEVGAMITAVRSVTERKTKEAMITKS